MRYYRDTPPEPCRFWQQEIDTVAWALTPGRGFDPACGGRTIDRATVAEDLHPQDGASLPRDWPACSFDWIFSSHALEHFENPVRQIQKWVRLLKPAGRLIMIVPNTLHTRGQNQDPTPHRFEWGPVEMLSMLEVEPAHNRATTFPWLPPRYVEKGVLAVPDGTFLYLQQFTEALPRWSMAIVLQKPE